MNDYVSASLDKRKPLGFSRRRRGFKSPWGRQQDNPPEPLAKLGAPGGQSGRRARRGVPPYVPCVGSIPDALPTADRGRS